MPCDSCDKKPKNNESCAFTKATVEINNPKQLSMFRKVVVPASMGDDVENPPKVGKYCNVILYYEANDQVYLYSSDGIPTKITVDIDELKKQIAAVRKDLTTETTERKEEDQKIWDEIEVIEAASDVVDVVGTYAELQQYDTSKLHDNDLIKVLQDETHDDAITYYRWSTSTSSFSYVGAEGPYYTATETDTLLAAKQDTLIAGANIQIAADGKTISATDTTYSAFTGATSGTAGTSGLVPAPSAGDEGKVLMGNGTWVDMSNSVLFMIYDIGMSYDHHVYPYTSDGSITAPLTHDEVTAKLEDALRKGKSIYVYWHDSSEIVWEVVSTGFSCNDFTLIDNVSSQSTMYTIYGDTNPQDPQDDTYFSSVATPLQPKLVAGSNISIALDGKTISATDTTYSAFTGATSLADGTSGLVPAPTTTDVDKFLKGDGTWGTVTAAANTIFYANSAATGTTRSIYKDAAMTTAATMQEIIDANEAGQVILRTTSTVDPTTYSDAYLQNAWVTSGDYQMLFLDESKYSEYHATTTSATTFNYDSRELQGKLTAGTNVTITGTTISATDTTYSAFTGATSQQAGAAGLVPAPTTSDPDKYLKGDGTWAALPGANNISSNDWSALWL